MATILEDMRAKFAHRIMPVVAADKNHGEIKLPPDIVLLEIEQVSNGARHVHTIALRNLLENAFGLNPDNPAINFAAGELEQRAADKAKATAAGTTGFEKYLVAFKVEGIL